MKPRLLFVYLAPTAFVRDDVALLRERYDVRLFHFDAAQARTAPERVARLAVFFVRQLAWLLRELPRAQGVFGWFADYHMLLPVLLARRLGRRSAVVIGGFDGNTMPELNYGVFASAWRGPIARVVVRRADLLLPNTPSLIYAERRYATWPEVRRNGLRAHVPDLETPCRVVPVGFDPAAWPMGPAERPAVACCVAYVRSEREVYVKGLDVLIEVARHLPDVEFRIVGVAPEAAARMQATYAPPANLALLPPRPREALAAVYQGASVYMQLSRLEGGLPNVVCEAMLCGCIPVVSEVGNMPDTVGEAGFVAPAPDAGAIAGLVRRALAAPPERRAAARRHVIDHFSVARRRAALLASLDALYETPAA